MRLGASLDDGTPVNKENFNQWLDEELSVILDEVRDDHSRKFDVAASLFRTLSTSDELVPFLTLPAYEHLTTFSDDE